MRVPTSVLVSIGLVVTTGRAWACDVVVLGSDATAWESAVAEVEASGDDSDCAEIGLHVDGNRARLTFRTSDGRTTERLLEDPSELLPTVQALRVTVPARDTSVDAPTTEAEPEPAPKKPESRASSPQRDEQSSPQRRVLPGGESASMFGLQVGGRGGADSLVSPILRGYGAILLDRWELALIAGYDARYHSVAEPPRAVKGSALVLGIGVGRYEPVGSFALTGGGRVMLAVLENEDESKDDPGAAEVRTGAYLGLVFPRLASTRFRTDLSAELVPQYARAADRRDDGTSFTPWWAIGWSVGIEMGGS